MGKDITRKELLSKLVESIQNEELSIFAGAGLSIPAGFLDWKNLLKEPAKSVGLDIEKEYDLLNVAQYFCNSNGRTEMEQIIFDSFQKLVEPTDNHKLLATLPINTYWTTNYDDLIEYSLRNMKKICNVITEDSQLKHHKKNQDVILYKMHGDYQKPHDAVITRNDYEEFGVKKRKFFREVLEGDLLTKTFLFLGFGFSDPNFNFVLSKTRILLEGDTRVHYCIMKRPLEFEFIDNDEFNYAITKQELMIADLFKSGIRVHLIEKYEEITQILKILTRKYKQKTIFISGSAYTYAPFEDEKATKFIEVLSRHIAEKGYNIVNGYGLGIGTYVINGVAEYAYSNSWRRISEHLTLMPFPQFAVNDKKLRDNWNLYRKEMIEKCGIAIFMFGNKLVNGEVVIADGMEKEFQIAKSNGAALIPLAFTGYKAKELYGRENNEKIKIEFSEIENTAKKIIELIEKINKEEL